jgi:Sec7-like guanine-nucleotide exchange factor
MFTVFSRKLCPPPEPDTCFILSFSIIMLNTALHNPNAKMKITADMFVKQNKGINSGKDLPADMLEAIFRSAYLPAFLKGLSHEQC